MLTFPRSRLLIKSKSVVSDIPPCTTSTRLLITVPRGNQRQTFSINFSSRSALCYIHAIKLNRIANLYARPNKINKIQCYRGSAQRIAVFRFFPRSHGKICIACMYLYSLLVLYVVHEKKVNRHILLNVDIIIIKSYVFWTFLLYLLNLPCTFGELHE